MAAGQLASVSLQAAYFIIIGRTLGSYQYGIFVAVYSLVSVLSPYSTLGFGMLMLRDVSRDRSKLARTWGRALMALSAGSLAVSALAGIAGWFLFHHQLLLIVLCVAFSDAFCTRAIELAGQAFQACHQLAWTARLTALMTLARTGAALFLFFYCLHTHRQAGALIWSAIYALFSLACASAALALVHFRLVRPVRSGVTPKDVAEGLSFALSTSSFSIYNDIDKTMLASMGFVQAAGTYAAAYRVIEVATAPVRAVYAAAMPRIFQHGEQGIRTLLKFSRRLLWATLLYSVVACAILYWVAPLSSLLLGKSFAASVPAIRILSWLLLLRCLHYSAGNAISGCASQWYRTSSQLFVALLNVGLNLALIPRYSWRGAAAASLMTDATLASINGATLLYLLYQSSPGRRALHESRLNTV
jgi:O-antigen/teichoic acid export membrane protein